MKAEILEIKHKRDRLHLALQENKTSIDVIIDAMYSDSETHFIWELLQNADDAEASYIEISTSNIDKQVILEHNGKPFTVMDVDGISNIGASSKKKEKKKTGKFGVGFKSVFTFCSSVEIHNGELAIELTNKLNFDILSSSKAPNAEKTLFIFKEVESPEALIGQVLELLKERPDAFMYLSNVRSLKINGNEFFAKNIYDEFISVKTENLTFSFKEDLKGTYYCMFPLKKEVGLPMHINAKFDVNAARDNLKDRSEINEELFREIDRNFVNIVEKVKYKISTKTMMDIILHSNPDYQLKTRKLLYIDGSFYSYNELARDMTADKLFEKNPFLLSNTNTTRCVELEGLKELSEDNIKASLQHYLSKGYLDFGEKYKKFILSIMEFTNFNTYRECSIFLTPNLSFFSYNQVKGYRLEVSSDMAGYVNLHSIHAILLNDDEIYKKLGAMGIANDYEIHKVYLKVLETKSLEEADLAKLDGNQRDILKSNLRKESLFDGYRYDEVWAADTLLYLFNPEKKYVSHSYLTGFLGVVTNLSKLTSSSEELKEENIIRVLTSGDRNRMLLMIDFLSEYLHILPFLKNKAGSIDQNKVDAFFNKIYLNEKIVMDRWGEQQCVCDCTMQSIDLSFYDAFLKIQRAPQIHNYLSKEEKLAGNAIWSYGDEEEETEYTRGLTPREIGYAGEVFAFEYFKSQYPDQEIKYLNDENETGEHYDILLDNKIKIEVKTRKSAFTHKRRGVKLSPMQVEECIKTAEDNFWLAIVNLDMQKVQVYTKKEILSQALKEFSINSYMFGHRAELEKVVDTYELM